MLNPGNPPPPPGGIPAYPLVWVLHPFNTGIQALGVTAKGPLCALVCTYFTEVVVDKARWGTVPGRDSLGMTLFVAYMVLSK